MTFDIILYEFHAVAGKITLNRLDKLNSFNSKMHEELRRCMKSVSEGVDAFINKSEAKFTGK